MKRDECYLCLGLENELSRAVGVQERRVKRGKPYEGTVIDDLKEQRAEHRRLKHPGEGLCCCMLHPGHGCCPTHPRAAA